MGSIRWHCFSVKSLGYLPRFMPLLSLASTKRQLFRHALRAGPIRFDE
jgi:hypothetical protein